MGRKPAALGLALVSVVAVSAFLVGAKADDTPSEQGQSSESQRDVATAEVTRQTLTETAEASGTVTYGDPIDIAIESQGIVTWAPAQDDLLSAGDTVVRIDDRPVTLAAGVIPLYRELRLVGSSEKDEAGDKLGRQSGADVEQLQRFLIDNGFDADGEMTVDGEFGQATEDAVQSWQKSVGHPQTGKVGRDQLVFIESDVRVDQAPLLGHQFTALKVSPPVRTIATTVQSAKKSFFTEGTVVDLEAGGITTTGTVTEATRTITAEGNTAYDLVISVDGELPEGVTSVDVTATKLVASDVLTIPVRALLALAEGGWAVEVPGPSGVELQRVELNEVVDTTASITGLDEGTKVVVPS